RRRVLVVAAGRDALILAVRVDARPAAGAGGVDHAEAPLAALGDELARGVEQLVSREVGEMGMVVAVGRAAFEERVVADRARIRGAVGTARVARVERGRTDVHRAHAEAQQGPAGRRPGAALRDVARAN